MAQIVTSVKNTFVHVDVDTPGCVEMGCNARRRASSTPTRATLEAAENEKNNAHAFGTHDVEDLLLPHDDDDYTSMHAHPGPSPLDMDVEGMLGCRVLEADVDDHYRDLSSNSKDETIPEFINFGMDVNDTASARTEDYSASAPASQGLTYGAQLPRDNYRESLAQDVPCLSAAPMSAYKPTQRQLFSTFPIQPHEAQRDSCMESYSVNSTAGVFRHAKHEETQNEEKRAKHAETQDTQDEETRTTVMLMNVPLRYTSSKLMRTIDSEGFASMYDFIYIPMTRARNSKGYAFVNLVSPSIAQRFLCAFDGFSSWSTSSKNVGRAIWAKQHQGLQTNIERYRNSTVLGKTVPDEYKPRLFQNGIEVPFPAPTRKSSKSVPTQRVEQPRKNKAQWTMSL